MRDFRTLLLVVVTATALIACTRERNDPPTIDSPERKSAEGFGGQLLVVVDPQKFVREWQRPETPKITPAVDVERGVPVGVLILFAGCKTNQDGTCNAVVDYLIKRPDGSVFTEQKGQPLWKEVAPPLRNFQLGRAILSFQLGPNDPPGKYEVTANCADLNAGISLDLRTQFRLR